MDVVLVHSGVTDSGEWDAVRPLLATHHHVVAPDMSGYGSKPAPAGEVALSDEVLAVFEGRAVLVGTSQGGRAVLETALAAPERVEKLVLIGANTFGWGEEVQRIGKQEEDLFDEDRFDEAADLMARWWLVGPEREPSEVDATLYERVKSMCVRSYEQQKGVDASLRRVEIEPARIAAPTLVMRGALDWPEVAVAAERYVRELPDAREAVIDACAHLPTMERPDEVARLIGDFIAESSGPRPA